MNIVLQSRRSRSYEYRLWKYAKRGFAVGVPGFVRNRINPSIFTTPPEQQSGLGLLLYVEALESSSNLTAFRPNQNTTPTKTPTRDSTGLITSPFVPIFKAFSCLSDYEEIDLMDGRSAHGNSNGRAFSPYEVLCMVAQAHLLKGNAAVPFIAQDSGKDLTEILEVPDSDTFVWQLPQALNRVEAGGKVTYVCDLNCVSGQEGHLSRLIESPFEYYGQLLSPVTLRVIVAYSFNAMGV